MALLVDGELSTIGDLQEQDNGVLDVTHGERIDLKTKLQLAQREIEIEVERLLRQENGGSLGQVVVTQAMRRWHVLRTLAMVYRDAYFSQLNDRYGARWRAYESEAREAGRKVLEGGVGMSTNPLRRPTGLTVRVEQGTQGEMSYCVQATWVDASGRESAPSAISVVVAPPQHTLSATVSQAPANATGWNLYAGTSPDTLARQTAAPLAPGAEWLMSPGGLLAGPKPVDSQTPAYYLEFQRLLWR